MPRSTQWLQIPLTAVAITAAIAPHGRCDGPATWLDVTPERPVDHAVMVRGPFQDAHDKVTVTGPVALVTIGPDAGSSFTAYRVARPTDAEARVVGVGDPNRPVRVGPAEFVLVPAKRLDDGPPVAGCPPAAYEVRAILEPDTIETPACAGRPALVCLPVDYRHHFERVPVADPGRGLLLGPAGPANPAAAIAVVDDFGTNRLTSGRTARSGEGIAVTTGTDR